MTEVLLIGASGFIGRALDDEVQRHPALKLRSLSSALLRQPDVSHIVKVLAEYPSDAIVQASGISHHRGQGFHALYEGNVMPTIRLASALDRLGRRDTPVYLLGSAAEVGPTDGPVAEATPCAPHTDYGRSKWLQTQFAHFKNRDGFQFSVLRLFNVVGAGMSSAQVPRCFLDPVLRGEPVLRTGALGYERDFIDVRDVARVMARLVETGWNGDLLHVCTGVGTTARRLLDEILRQTGREVVVDERLDPAPGDFHSVGSPRRLEAAMGGPVTWSAARCIEELIASTP